MLVRDVLSRLENAPLVPLSDLVGPGGIVVLAPHPDDETLGCGGLIAEACAQGRRVEVVFVTDGSASHPGSTLYPPRRLAKLRAAEARQAVATLGVSAEQVSFLGLPDAAAPRSGPQFEQAVAAIGAALDRVDATALFVTWEHDPHCDHEVAASMAFAAARARPLIRLWRYPIWGLRRAPDDNLDQEPWRGVRLDVSSWQARKREAIACHASQLGLVIDDDPDGFSLTSDIMEPFLGPFERFIGAAP